MEETEKMKGLKKAYAEIILNTAKEAAVRVMASERKVHQFQYDLSSTKDEALRLLLRLKQSMDVKINEAEMKSLNQQRRIEELEAQLQEAEDIVGNLRAELNEAHMKLEEMEHKQVINAPIISEDAHCEEITKQTENGLPEAALVAQTVSSTLTHGHYLENNYVKEYCFSGDPVVPSIIRSKKPELYRNGCTQRIRAYEGSLLNGHFSLSGEFDDLKYEKCIREDKEGEGIYVTSAGKEATLSTGKNLFDIQEVEDVDNSSSKPQALKSFRRKRTRAARYRSSDASTLKSMLPLAKQAPSDTPSSQAFLLDSQGMPENGEIKVKGTHSSSPSVSPSNLPVIGVLSGCVETAQGDNADARMITMNVNTEVTSSLVMIKEQHGSGDCLDVPSSKEDLEMKTSSLVNPDCKLQEAGDGFYSPPPKDRVLKYTFQRKRKKESFIGDDGSLHEENPLKRKMVNKENENHELLNCSTVAASSRDSRRMAQVARQLLTLSEKKWTK